MNALAAKLKALSSALSSLKEANDDSWAGIREQQAALIDQITSARETISNLSASVSSELSPSLHEALNKAQGASSSVSSVLGKLQSSTSALSGTRPRLHRNDADRLCRHAEGH